MSSNEDWLDDLAARLTPEDSEAMRRSSERAQTLTWEQYLRFLDANAHLARRVRKTHEGYEPFSL